MPVVTGNLYVAGDITRAVSIFARATLLGRQTVFSERFTGARITLDAHTLLELVVQWRATPAVSAYVRVENLLDTDYLTAFDRPGIHRTAVLGFRLAP